MVVGVGALLGPYFSDDIIGGLVASYEVAVGALFIPTVCAVLSKKTHLPKEAAIGSALLGTVGTIASQILALGFVGALMPLGLSMVGFMLGLSMSKRRLPEAI